MRPVRLFGSLLDGSGASIPDAARFNAYFLAEHPVRGRIARGSLPGLIPSRPESGAGGRRAVLYGFGSDLAQVNARMRG